MATETFWMPNSPHATQVSSLANFTIATSTGSRRKLCKVHETYIHMNTCVMCVISLTIKTSIRELKLGWVFQAINTRSIWLSKSLFIHFVLLLNLQHTSIYLTLNISQLHFHKKVFDIIHEAKKEKWSRHATSIVKVKSDGWTNFWNNSWLKR